MAWHGDDIEYVLEHLNAPGTLMDQEFITWLEKEDHRVCFEEIRNQRESFLRHTDAGHINVEAEYRRLSQNKVFVRRIRYRRWGIAAACLLIVLMIPLLVNRKETNVSEWTKAEEYVGRKSAELILANGERIKLERSVIELRESNGTWISNDSNYQLAYHRDTLREGKEKKLVYNTLQIPAGADYIVCLSDGTRVRLNCGTEFRFPVNFVGNERRVYLDGEAFFEVSKSREWPFIVVTDKMEVCVTGTRFNVKSYRNDPMVATTLVSGSVQVRSDESGINPVHLAPSQQFRLDKNSGKSEVSEVDVRLHTAWTEGMFVFKNERLEEVMEALARWYSVHVFYSNTSVKDLRLSANLGRYEHIDTLLRIVQAMDKIKIERQGNVVTLSWK